jgi:hypothetical protein
MNALRLLLGSLAVAAVFAIGAGAQDKQKDDPARAEKAARERALKEAQLRRIETERAAAVSRQQAQQDKQAQINENLRRLQQIAAQDRAVMEAQAAQVAQQRIIAGNVAVNVGGIAGRQMWPDEQFERWVFPQDQTADRVRNKFESLLNSKVDQIERTCELTLTQVRKLRMMGQGDIKRFFDTYEKAKSHFKALNNDPGRIQEIQPDLAPVRSALQGGPFTEDSLLNKSLRTTLTEEQFSRYEGVAGERRAFRHRANVELAVAMLEQAMPLSGVQRRELIALLQKETSPPRKGGQYEAYLILNQMSHLPPGKLKALFSETQKQVLDAQLAQYAATIGNLRQSGLVVDDDLAFPVPAALPPAGAQVPAFRLAPAAPPK